MYIFMPTIWFPVILWCGFNDAPFWAIFWTLILGRLEVAVQDAINWLVLNLDNIEDELSEAMKIWEYYVLHKAEIDNNFVLIEKEKL